MNRIGIQLCRVSLLLLLVAATAVFRAIAQQSRESVPLSKISFSSEDDKFADAVPLPDCVRQLLATDEHVVNTLEYEQLPAEQLPADWFTASRTELGEHSGTYFVVMCAGVLRGPNIYAFWLFERSPQSCNLTYCFPSEPTTSPFSRQVRTVSVISTPPALLRNDILTRVEITYDWSANPMRARWYRGCHWRVICRRKC